jgi:hypothetical protein
MKKFFVIAMIAIACLSAVGCATRGLPVQYAPTNLSGVNASASKVGVSEGKVWFGIFGSTDGMSAIKAAQNGGITKIAVVETTFKLGILGLWIDFTTTVAGE